MTPPMTNEFGLGKKHLGRYITGFMACVVLTWIPFHMVLNPGTHTRQQTLAILLACAVLQFLVQVRSFLCLNMQDEEGTTNALSFILIVVVLVILVGGSLWIMTNLHHRM